MINIPHQKPLKFVNKIVNLESNKLEVECLFPYTPTLAMICEAAAQSTALLSNSEKPKIGFLATLKDITLNGELKKTQYTINICRGFNFAQITEFTFNIQEKDKFIVKGNFTIVLNDENK